MSIRPVKLHFENVNSYYGKHEINLDNNFFLIKGKNKADQSSNGSGKSTIIDIICMTIFGKSIKKELNVDDLISHNENEMYMELFFVDDSGTNYSIKRTRNRKKKETICNVYKNEEVISSNMTTTETQALIEKIIGISFSMFASNNVLDTNIFRFIKSPSSDKLAVLEKVLGLDVLSKLYAQFGKADKIEQELYQQASKESYALKTSIENLEVQKETFRKNVEENINALKLRNEELSIKGKLLANERDEKNTKYENAKMQLEGVEKAIKIEKAALVDEERLYLETKKSIDHYTKNITCRECGQALPNRDEELSKLTPLLKVYEDEITTTKKIINELELNPLFDDLKGVTTRLSDIKVELNNINFQIDSNYKQITKLATVTKDTTNIDEVKGRFSVAIENEKSVKSSYDKVSFWKEFLAPKSDGRVKIASDLIEVLNATINNVIKDFYTEDIRLKFSINNSNIEETIVINGNKTKYDQMSSGERQKLDIIVVLSLLEISSVYFKNNKLKILVADEITDSLDNIWADMVCRYIKSYSKKANLVTLVISHHSIVDDIGDIFDNVIIVEKENGKSKIVENIKFSKAYNDICIDN